MSGIIINLQATTDFNWLYSHNFIAPDWDGINKTLSLRHPSKIKSNDEFIRFLSVIDLWSEFGEVTPFTSPSCTSSSSFRIYLVNDRRPCPSFNCVLINIVIGQLGAVSLIEIIISKDQIKWQRRALMMVCNIYCSNESINVEMQINYYGYFECLSINIFPI